MGEREISAMIRDRKAALAALAFFVPLCAHAAQDPGTRLTPAEMSAMAQGSAGAGTSGVAGIQTTVLTGNPAMPGLYTLRLTAPPGTRIQAHSHRDARSAMVVSGNWYFGYGAKFDAGALKLLPQGSFYTEPAGQPHFAETRGEGVVLIITGYGPTDTVYVDPANAPPPAR